MKNNILSLTQLEVDTLKKLLPDTGCTAVFPSQYPNILSSSGFKSRSEANPKRFPYSLGTVVSFDPERPSEI